MALYMYWDGFTTKSIHNIASHIKLHSWHFGNWEYLALNVAPSCTDRMLIRSTSLPTSLGLYAFTLPIGEML